MGNRGRELETAISRGLLHYKKSGAADIEKKSIARLWNGTIVGGAATDFTGIAWNYGPRGENIGIHAEAKETHKSQLEFGQGGLRQDQFDALNEYVAKTKCIDGVPQRMAFVVVDFTERREVYRLDWRVVQREFLDVAWRKSISLDWARAFGQQLKETDRDDPRHRRVWLLDAFDHELKPTAYLAIAAERAKHAGERVELFPVEQKFRRRVNAEKMPPPGTEAYRERIIGAANDGLTRAMRGKPKWSPRRGAKR